MEWQRYNGKQRFGKGFSLEELKAAGLGRHYAQTIGIAVDYKRRNKSCEGMQENVQRLKQYKAKLILFPKKVNKPKKGEATVEEMAMAQQVTSDVLPFKQKFKKEMARAITPEDHKHSCFIALRTERANARFWGLRAKKAKENAEEAAVTGKK